jgi:hypothetical protein
MNPALASAFLSRAASASERFARRTAIMNPALALGALNRTHAHVAGAGGRFAQRTAGTNPALALGALNWKRVFERNTGIRSALASAFLFRAASASERFAQCMIVANLAPMRFA